MHHGHKVVQLSMAPVLAEAMLRVQMGQSLEPLRAYGLGLGGGGGGGAGAGGAEEAGAEETERYSGQG